MGKAKTAYGCENGYDAGSSRRKQSSGDEEVR